jgi:alpha-glucosidase/alpha-D-xyloside xylohydrolase
MKPFVRTVLAPLALFATAGVLRAQQITAAGRPAELDVRAAGAHAVRVTLKPVDYAGDFPFTPAVAEQAWPAPAISLREVTAAVTRRVGSLTVEVRPDPLSLHVTDADGRTVQDLVFEPDGTLSFVEGGAPVLGLGEGGPRPVRGQPWKQRMPQFDRRGSFFRMQPRWQSDAYGSRNPVAMLVGTAGWGLFVATPWVEVDLRDPDRGLFIPWKPPVGADVPQNERNQGLALDKGKPPVDSIVPGLWDLFVFDGRDPAALMKDFSTVTGPAAMPPRWALGYMQSHRTLESDSQMVAIIDTFRAKKIPLDAVIYLGTGFTPRGWNTEQPSFQFNPAVFKHDPRTVLREMHRKHVKVVLHMVPWDRDKLPTLHGSIPPKPGETVDADHILTYWKEHVPLVKEYGVDAFWPDEGDWFNLFERMERQKMYYQGPLWTKPDVRPWNLERNGYPGIAKYDGWVWSGDTQSSWKTLETQIAVGLNYSLSIGPYWGSDTGGFYATGELTGELYARWFQFSSFCGSFRSHGRTWWLRLPWGWGLSDMGPREGNNENTSTDSSRFVHRSELNNPAIEPVARKYDDLRYELLPYTYTLAWQARTTGMPLMRAMWLEFPNDDRARGLADQYMWGPSMLIAPVYTKGATSRDVYLPQGTWYDWWTSAKVTGGRTVERAVDLATMPIYVRAGAIVPLDPVRQYTGQKVNGPTTLRVYTGADGAFTLYDDDGTSQRYLSGKGTWTRMTWDDGVHRFTVEPGTPAGATELETRRTFKVVLLPSGTSKEVRYSGKRVTIDF